MRAIFSGAAVLIFAASAGAQPRPDPADLPALRYELGQRLKRFEAAWEKHPGPESRKAALGHVQKLTQQFFAFQFGEAARSLDRAGFQLGSDDEPALSRQWAWSLYAVPETRVADGTAKELTVTVKQLYAVKGDVPKGLEVQLWFTDKQVTILKPDKFPLVVKVPLPPLGDFKGLDRKLYFMVEAGKELRHTAIGVSQVADPIARLLALKKAVTGWDAVDSIERATVRDRCVLLEDLMFDKTVPETDLPAADLLANAEAMIDGKPFFTAAKPGQFWLTIPTSAKTATAARLFVPRGLDEAGGGAGEPAGCSPLKKKPVPIVVALHGAGGSENLFFEGYGAGQIVTECRKRGWLLVAPRSGFGLSGSPPVPALLDELAKRYPIDPNRVFVVGHSMGAMQTVELVQKHPGKFAAVAVLGGAAPVRDTKAFADLPVFVGVGEKDGLMLTAVRGLNKALDAGGAKKVTYKEYPHVEHMVIVRAALPDAFAVFDRVVK